MTKTYRKYTKEMLEEAARSSISYAGVLRYLGLKMAGGTHSHIKRMMTKLEVDTDHFTRQAHNKGKPDPKRLSANEVLIYDRNKGRREHTFRLKRALLEIGRAYECETEECSVENWWADEPLTLHVDHANGDPLDNRAENLRFLCPNCHSQTPTYNRRKQVRQRLDKSMELVREIFEDRK